MISVFDLFKIGIGPSSSHTVGPMRAAYEFADALDLPLVDRVQVECFGSLGATGHGHGTVRAVVAGLSGELPHLVDPAAAQGLLAAAEAQEQVLLMGSRPVHCNPAQDIVLHRRKALPFHSNGMLFRALMANGEILSERTFYSIGGGFIIDHDTLGNPSLIEDPHEVPYPFTTSAQLLGLAESQSLRISDIVLANECSRRPEAEVRAGILEIWQAMQDCVAHGIAADGELPGGLKVRRRAKASHEQLSRGFDGDPLHAMEWVTMFALAVNEENAAGGRVVTAPTNGAAGIIPAVLHYYSKFDRSCTEDGIIRFFLAATAVGWLFKKNASISGAEVGCQGEVGAACSMAAAGLAEVLGGSPAQVENAAEIGIEHNLGLTCDPVGGLVQIPCIERNAIAAIKAITAARMAIRGDGKHHVTLDSAIKTMRETGEDMKVKYKETARGGLALNVVEC